MDLVGFCVIFACAGYCIQIAYHREQNGEGYRGLIFLCGLLLVIPAGIRNNDIGTDIAIYQYPLFRYAVNSSTLMNYFSNAFVSDVEALYALLVYVLAKITNNINVLYFVEECLIVYPIIYCIWYYRDRVEPGYAFVAYEALFYFDSYNIVRQWLAISLCMVALVMWEKANKVRSIILVAISFMFHKTAIIMLAIIMLHEIYAQMEGGRKKYILIGGIAILTLYFSFNYERIFIFVVQNVSLLRSRYVLDNYLHRAKVDFPVLYFILWDFFLIGLLAIRKGRKNDVFIGWNIMMLVISILSVSFFAKGNFAIRVLLYVQIFSVFAAGYCRKLIKDNSLSVMIYASMYYAVMSSVWIYNNYINGVHGVFPFHTVWFTG